MIKKILPKLVLQTWLLLFVATACLSAGAVTPADAKSLAERSESSLSVQQRAALVEAQGRMAAIAFQVCARQLSGEAAKGFAIVAELDSRGTVIETWQMQETAFTVCFGDVMRSELSFVPPFLPFYTTFDYSSAK
jgi:hypothetical protein